jgi:hypothetical protein
MNTTMKLNAMFGAQYAAIADDAIIPKSPSCAVWWCTGLVVHGVGGNVGFEVRRMSVAAAFGWWSVMSAVG